MYAIARIAGKQFRIEPDQKVKVPLLPVQPGEAYQISDILLAADGDKVKVGSPLAEGFKATATVVSHGREPKIIVWRKKRRKGFQKIHGHRQDFTLLQIGKIEGKF
ncbi:MAG: 50S ribosomal protein L21 [Candidatus Zixiibacteriota bacterium]|nr:MAG: 50S ribosomal protein L21 [candidate division Zixibacteria bacterium]